MQPKKREVYTYRADRENRIVYVSDNWQAFAEANGGGDSCRPDRVLGAVIWDFIADWETRHLYQIIVDKVRKKQVAVSVPIRCDSPDQRRIFDISISPSSQMAVEFQSKVVRIEPRDPVGLLGKGSDSSKELVRICSFCKKIAVSKGKWVETEKGIESLDLFRSAQLPQLTHGVCLACREAILGTLR